MAIYGTALLAICLLVGSILGKWLGDWVGVDANVGGVGIAMLLLILVCGRLQGTGRLAKPTEQGVLFWSSIYIPVVVAMAASQNVRKAISGGPVAILAGVLAVAVCFTMVPLVDRIGRSDPSTSDQSPPDESPASRSETGGAS